MKVAKPADWKTEHLPAKHTTVSLNRRFTPDEMKRIKRGLIPEQMEDKWFIFFDQDMLHFHRSWTGFCIYKAYFQKDGDGYILTHAEVNRDPDHYMETDDTRDQQMVSYLIDILLLHKHTAFPSVSGNIEQNILMEWSLVGRAMLGKHPKQ
jgi:hypothetical protein